MFKIKLITMPVFIGRESLYISGYPRILVASHIVEATSSLCDDTIERFSVNQAWVTGSPKK